MHNNHHSIQVPCKFQINRFINNRAVDDPNTRAVDDQGTRAGDIPSIRAVDDPITRAVDDPSKGQRRAAIAALHASTVKRINKHNAELRRTALTAYFWGAKHPIIKVKKAHL